MKVIKRDGRAVDYDRQKIVVAIEKANQDVRKLERAEKEDINKIINYIEELGKKRMLVEDIQDIIEQKLMEFKKFELAKKYIVYRYTRALVRKQNTTDESILGLIRRNNNTLLMKGDSNKTPVIVSDQRDLIAGEVSKDLTKRMLLPEKISKAHEEGVLYFHGADYFLQPIFNSSLIDINDMLENGTVINGKLIKTPETFLDACIIINQIIASVASSQYGGHSFEVKHLGKYLRKTQEKFKKELLEEYKGKISEEIIEQITKSRVKYDLIQGIQTLQYQINTFMTTNIQAPYVTIFLKLEQNHEYIEENAMIIEEMLNQRYEGIKNEKGEFVAPDFPKLTYVLDEHNCLKGGKYDYLTRLAIKCSAKTMYPNYISAKKMRENFEGNVFSPIEGGIFLSPWKDVSGNYKFEGRFNQGVVSINLPQVALVSDSDENKFWAILEERLELCKEALMCRHYSLLGTISDVSPIHWKYGAIARLQPGEKIDKLLKGGYSTLSLGYIGIFETTKLIKGVSHTTKEGREFALKLIKYLKDTIKGWEKETGLGFTLCGSPGEAICYKFANIDKEIFGTIKEITDKGYYTNSYYIDETEKLDTYSKLLFENNFQKTSLCGALSYIKMSSMDKNIEELEELIKFIYENIQYAQFDTKLNVDISRIPRINIVQY